MPENEKPFDEGLKEWIAHWRDPSGYPKEGCLTPLQVHNYADDSMGWWERRRVERHLRACPYCLGEALKAQNELAPARDTPEIARGTPKWAYGLAIAAVLVLVVFGWNREARLRAAFSRQRKALMAKADALTQQKETLQRSKNGDASHLIEENTVQRKVIVTVEKLVMTGMVLPAKSVQGNMATLRSDATRGELQRAESEKKPVPLSPVLTALRSTRPTLRWQAFPGAKKYQVTVAYPEEKESGKVVWEGSAGTQTQVTLPAGVLQRGQVYFWQVEAIVEGQSFVSPVVGFWVLNTKELGEVEEVERRFKSSTLVLISTYEKYGLYGEALAQVERLRKTNPSPFVQEMLHKLNHQLGKE